MNDLTLPIIVALAFCLAIIVVGIPGLLPGHEPQPPEDTTGVYGEFTDEDVADR